MDPLATLTPHIFALVLRHLSAEELVSAAGVCWDWRKSAEDELLWAAHCRVSARTAGGGVKATAASGIIQQ